MAWQYSDFIFRDFPWWVFWDIRNEYYFCGEGVNHSHICKLQVNVYMLEICKGEAPPPLYNKLVRDTTSKMFLFLTFRVFLLHRTNALSERQATTPIKN